MSLRASALSAAPVEPALNGMSRARQELLDRLCEVAVWPSSRISLHERDLAADLLVGLLQSSSLQQRIRLAERLAPLADASKPLLRYLICDHIDVATPLLKAGVGLDDSDLVHAVDEDRPSHAILIAARRHVSPLVCEALAATAYFDVLDVMLRNAGATLSSGAVDVLLQQSRSNPALPALLATRPELRASQALVLFWWADGPTRASILRRFAIERTALVGELGSVFLTAADERWQDSEARQALLMIERRQRTRFDSKGEKAQFEATVTRLAQIGFDASLVAEVAHQTSLRPMTAVRVFKDQSGEPLAVWAKASGLRRTLFEILWSGMQGDAAFEPQGQARRERAMMVFDTLSTAKAQGVLRVWNWAIGAAAELALTQPALVKRGQKHAPDDAL